MNYQYDEEMLNKLHDLHKEMMKDFHTLCKKHGIRYFAVYGTLLGAIRERGFIPWDDDVDFGLLREDFDKLLSIPPEEYNDKYAILAPDLGCVNYDFIPKFERKDSKFISPWRYATGIMDENYLGGVFIDLFVYENIDPKAFKKQVNKVGMIKVLNFEAVTHRRLAIGTGIRRMLKKGIKWILYVILRVLRFDGKKAAKVYLATVNQPEETGWVNDFFKLMLNHLIKKKDLLPIIEKEFEDITICVPNNYDEMLRNSYGVDYMTPPPLAQRVNHAPIMIQFPGEDVIELRKTDPDSAFNEYGGINV